jgi:hypothetical protein
MLADEVDYLIGVDTHRDQHTLAVVAAPTGAVLAQTVVRTKAPGYANALRFAAKHTVGTRAWAVASPSPYGSSRDSPSRTWRASGFGDLRSDCGLHTKSQHGRVPDRGYAGHG